jgi:hypothetical protein
LRDEQRMQNQGVWASFGRLSSALFAATGP